ncbi:MAG TPA: response regulator [Chloroflexota bacterium]|nr:response regulator [Chloroflexota bacterium]
MPPKRDRPNGRPKATIVVVNDNPEFLELAQTLLQEEGYRVEVCQEGQRAYAFVKKAMPALVILDVRIVGVGEWQVLDMLKLDPETAKIPILVCSAAVNEVRAVEARLHEQGCEILFKPFEIDELLEKVQRLTGPQ